MIRTTGVPITISNPGPAGLSLIPGQPTMNNGRMQIASPIAAYFRMLGMVMGRGYAASPDNASFSRLPKQRVSITVASI